MMLFDRLKALFRKAPAAGQPAAEETHTTPYLTETVTFGNHLHKRPGDDPSVVYVDPVRGIRKTIVDKNGWIQHFPGIVTESFWVKEVSPKALLPQIHFRTSFEERGDKWIMRWQIQPDGRYWADDDGFGMEHEDEVVLYTYLDRQGNFTGPFRIYQVGNRGYALDRYLNTHAYSYHRALEEIRAGKQGRSWSCTEYFPPIRGACVETGNYGYYDIYYELGGRKEAEDYWKDPVLSGHLLELSAALLETEGNILPIGSLAERKRIRGCMTLFREVSGHPVFQQVLDKFYDGEPDQFTLRKLK